MNPSTRRLLIATLITTALLGSFVAWRISIRIEMGQRVEHVQHRIAALEPLLSEYDVVIAALQAIDEPDLAGDVGAQLDRARAQRAERMVELEQLQDWLSETEPWVSNAAQWLFTSEPPPL